MLPKKIHNPPVLALKVYHLKNGCLLLRFFSSSMNENDLKKGYPFVIHFDKI